MADTPEEEFIYEDHSQLPSLMPIFPLPNVVLLPNASLPLFIFEDRYKQMVRDCIESDRYLSVALLKKGWEQQAGTPRPFPIAGFGRIIRATRLPNDCMDIVVQGMGRLHMTDFHDDRPYLRATVTLLRPTYAAGEHSAAQIDALRDNFLKLLDVKGIPALELRTSLKLLASLIDVVFFIAAHLPLDAYAKQQLLEMVRVDEQVATLRQLLERLIGAQLN